MNARQAVYGVALLAAHAAEAQAVITLFGERVAPVGELRLRQRQ
jgi:hypothetical protein